VDELILAMKVHDFALRLYSEMLRLYPARFQAEYADEMCDVFGQVVDENENILSLLRLLLAEVRDLPISALREHWRERQLQPIGHYQESRLMKRLYSPRLLRFCALAILALGGLYGLSVVSAYFAFDMQHHSLQNSEEWWYTIANNPTFISNHLPIELIVLIIYLLIMPTIVIFGSALGLNALGRWRGLALHERRLALLALGMGLLVLISLNTPIVYIGGLWFYD
jgi:hypothetical protein